MAEATTGVPCARFTSDSFAEVERRHFWNRTWILVGRSDELAGPGNYFMWERTGVPFIVIRSADGEVRAFYNSCRHRGAPVVREPRGRNRALRCQYHSWTYDTFGRLVSVPDERDFVDLRLEERWLVPVTATERDGWIFLNEDRAPVPLDAFLARAGAAELPGAGLRALQTVVRTVNSNWKTAAVELPAILSSVDGLGPASTLFPNGAIASGDGFLVGLFAWPYGWPGSAVQSDLVAFVCAPDWEDEDSPVDEAPWPARIAAVEAALEGAAVRLAARQEAIAAGPEVIADDPAAAHLAATMDHVMGDAAVASR